jgi:predicted metal-dependent HD superfamily phosphohydrolase
MRQRFLALWQRCLEATADDASNVLQLLEECYGQANRRYHGPGHIRFCLEQYDRAAPQIEASEGIELAIWFHDAVHDPGSPTNEADSADLFRAVAGNRRPPLVERVGEMILETTHAYPPSSADARWLVDIDLAGLGQPWERFAEDARLIRAEHLHLPDAIYRGKQQAFLRALIDRPLVYQTRFFRDRYEQRARANIARILDSQAA